MIKKPLLLEKNNIFKFIYCLIIVAFCLSISGCGYTSLWYDSFSSNIQNENLSSKCPFYMKEDNGITIRVVIPRVEYNEKYGCYTYGLYKEYDEELDRYTYRRYLPPRRNATFILEIDVYAYDVNELPFIYEMDSVTINIDGSNSIIRPKLVIDTMFNVELDTLRPKNKFKQNVQYGPFKVEGRLPKSFKTSFDLIIKSKEDSTLIERRRGKNEWKLTGKLRIVDIIDGV